MLFIFAALFMIKFAICFFKQRLGKDFCWSDVSVQRGYLAKKKQGQKNLPLLLYFLIDCSLFRDIGFRFNF